MPDAVVSHCTGENDVTALPLQHFSQLSQHCVKILENPFSRFLRWVRGRGGTCREHPPSLREGRVGGIDSYRRGGYHHGSCCGYSVERGGQAACSVTLW